MKKLKNSYYVYVVIVCVIAAMIGWGVLTPSEPNYIDRSQFNVIKAYQHIEAIAKEPHSIFDEAAHTRVREYLLNEFEELGLDPEVYHYENIHVERTDTNEELDNIYVEIPGQNDSYIMLVTHYDSSHAKTERYAERDGSFGAADAGYGVSTILETLRVILENDIELVNGIKILITDGEEYGLLGAKEAVNEPEIFEDVNYLINLEARGIRGPAVMFETSLNNQSVLELYENSTRPYSYSINPEIYRLIPNATDFTVFLQHDIKGVNISVLDGLEHYHTPEDSIDYISLESIQHYGDQVLPIVTAFVTNPNYSTAEALESEEDSIFFTLTKTLFIRYTHMTNWILIGLIFVGLLIIMKVYQVKLISMLKYFIAHFVCVILFAAIGYGVSNITAQVIERPFKLTYLPQVPFEKVALVGVLIVTFLIYYISMYAMSKKHQEIHAYMAGVIGFLLFLSLIITAVLPGGSYLTVFPAVLIIIGFIISEIFARNYQREWAFVMLIPLGLIIILYVPTIYLFNAALTFGALAVTMIFVLIAFMTISSCILHIKHYMTSYKI